MTGTAPSTHQTARVARLAIAAATVAALVPLAAAGAGPLCPAGAKPPQPGQEHTLTVEMAPEATSYRAGTTARVLVQVTRTARTGIVANDAQGVEDANVLVQLRHGHERRLRSAGTDAQGRATLSVPIPSNWRGTVSARGFASRSLLPGDPCTGEFDETGEVISDQFLRVR